MQEQLQRLLWYWRGACCSSGFKQVHVRAPHPAVWCPAFGLRGPLRAAFRGLLSFNIRGPRLTHTESTMWFALPTPPVVGAANTQRRWLVLACACCQQ